MFVKRKVWLIILGAVAVAAVGLTNGVGERRVILPECDAAVRLEAAHKSDLASMREGVDAITSCHEQDWGTENCKRLLNSYINSLNVTSLADYTHSDKECSTEIVKIFEKRVDFVNQYINDV